VYKIREGLAADIVKKFQKDAKQWVRENISESSAAPKLDIEHQGGQPEAGSKRKMSPRSLQRVRKIVDARVKNTKHDILANDDRVAMRRLREELLCFRMSGAE